jgi:peptidoglycan/LPS O-acetylase OafA/YrhL
MMSPGLFRLFLASIVVVQHFSRIALGTMAVYVFFMLSGYWVSRMWMTKYALMPTPYRTFILSRLGRLLPVFLLVTVVMILMRWYAGSLLALSWWENVSTWVLLGYASISGGGYLIPAWSLDLEMQYYLLAPALLWLIAKLRRPGLILGMMLPLAAILMASSRANFPIVLPYLLFFSIGMVSYVHSWRPSAKLEIASVAVCVAALLLAVALPMTRGLVFVGAHPGPLSEYNGRFCVVLAAFAAPVAIATVWRRSPKWDRALGDISYVVYLVHFPFAWWADRYYLEHPTISRLPLVAISIASTYVVSALIWRYFDNPISKWRERALSQKLVSERATA